MCWVEIIKLIPSFILIGVAVYGIEAWRREHVGKRRIELAEDTLALFYQAADAIKYMRNPLAFEHERKDVERGEDESEDEFKARKNYSVVFYRYNQYQELFSKIHAFRYRFMAQRGKTEAAPFDELRKIVSEIKDAAVMLARLWPRDDFCTDEEWKKHCAQRKEYRFVLWETSEDDPINLKIDKVIADIDKTCRSIIAGKNK